MRAATRNAPSPTARIAALAKLAAAGAVSDRRMRDPVEHLAWIDSGAPFEEAGIPGFLSGLPDLPDGPIPAEAIQEMNASLRAGAGPECAGAWYMEAVPRAFRHPRGEFYTPPWLVTHVLDRAGFDGSSTLVDPMCGAGAFVIAALERALRRHPGLPAREAAERVQGMDVSQLAVLLARSAYLLTLAAAGWKAGREPLRIPVDCSDAILCAAARRFDIVAGNPPWIGWENLPEEYRRRTRPLWKHHGLFPDGGGGMSAMLGRGKKDLAMLATYAAADRFLLPGGSLAFIVPQSALKSIGGGAGFRRFVLGDGTPLKVVHVDDFGSMPVFPGAASRAAVVTLQKGEPTCYPVPYSVWRHSREAPEEHQAEPLRAGDPSSPWITGAPERIRMMRRVLGRSDYRARAGAYTGGANGVYWIEVTERAARGPWTVSNIADAGKRRVPRVTAPVESDLLYPLLRARDLGRLRVDPSGWILLPQDPGRRRGIPIEVMAARHPKTLEYLGRFEGPLADRRDRGTRALISAGAPFYSIFSVSTETLSPWKVVWPRIASRLIPAVVGPHEGKPVIPQETCTFVACSCEEEACYLAGMLASDLVNEAAASFAQAGSKSFGAPHLLSAIAIPRFDPSRPAHARLAAIVKDRCQGGDATEGRLQDAAAQAW